MNRPGSNSDGGLSLLTDLLRRVAVLERHRPTGMGVSTAFGATEVRAMQTGFPAELTSGFNDTTGYAWKQLYLDRPNSRVTNPSVQRTGTHAFTPDNNELLISGIRGWLEVDPQAGGWLFIAVDEDNSGGGSGSGTGSGASDEISFTFVSNVTCDDNGLTVTRKVGYIGFDGTNLTYRETNA